MLKINVLLSEESPFFRKKISKYFENDTRTSIEAVEADNQSVLRSLRATKKDAVILSVSMTADLSQVIDEIVNDLATPVVLLTTNKYLEGTQIMQYLQLGAFDYVLKPSDPADSAGIDIMLNQLSMRLKNAVSSRLETFNKSLKEFRTVNNPRRASSPDSSLLSKAPRLLAFGASTGGPAVLTKIMSELPAELPVPIVITQHMVPDFMPLFAEELRKHSRLKVQIAQHGTVLENGTITVAPGGKHMTILKSGDHYVAAISANSEGLINCPSIDKLFGSVADYIGAHACGVILTGMGEDGAIGLKMIDRMGGITIAEDRSTALIYGMPAVAIAMGAAKNVLPSFEIAPFIKRLYGLRDQ